MIVRRVAVLVLVGSLIVALGARTQALARPAVLATGECGTSVVTVDKPQVVSLEHAGQFLEARIKFDLDLKAGATAKSIVSVLVGGRATAQLVLQSEGPQIAVTGASILGDVSAAYDAGRVSVDMRNYVPEEVSKAGGAVELLVENLRQNDVSAKHPLAAAQASVELCATDISPNQISIKDVSPVIMTVGEERDFSLLVVNVGQRGNSTASLTASDVSADALEGGEAESPIRVSFPTERVSLGIGETRLQVKMTAQAVGTYSVLLRLDGEYNDVTTVLQLAVNPEAGRSSFWTVVLVVSGLILLGVFFRPRKAVLQKRVA